VNPYSRNSIFGPRKHPHEWKEVFTPMFSFVLIVSKPIDMAFSDFYLVKEAALGDSPFTPSIASGLNDNHIPFSDGEVVWLIEPFRSASVRRWSGTNQHPVPKEGGLLGATLYALAHFTVIYTGHDMVLSDIQSMCLS